MEYLGANIDSSGCKDHAAKRISSCRKAFYTLQGAGLCKDGVKYRISNACVVSHPQN